MARKGKIDWDKEEARQMARKGKIDWDKEEARKMSRKGEIDWDKEEARKMAIKDCQKPCPRFIGEICASDNNTYWNKCTFEIAKCEAKLYGVTLTMKNNGPCNSKHPGEIDWDKEEARKMAIKDCQKRCPRFIGEICASDNNTYWNKCTFEIAKCEAKLYGVTL